MSIAIAMRTSFVLGGMLNIGQCYHSLELSIDNGDAFSSPAGGGVTSWLELQYAARQVTKVYWALCSGEPLPVGASGLIEAQRKRV